MSPFGRGIAYRSGAQIDVGFLPELVVSTLEGIPQEHIFVVIAR